ncbi:hypothetical protein [Virgisporangium aurantiacum]|uniref:Uncharacterized protein n=1 Tax=Virgisporangium aurantiacum TaxID=175570 RepID=A0A8J3YX13_9ACTN|nr:hypothetical protein [Virgisporangium aurantiacum]GIJ53219.1 hypothetical protein Vau01_007350 [Virgisporangium aurantiacum]
MTRIRTWLERLADRIHGPGDDLARTAGLTVERLPGGRRRISDPRVTAWLNQRRQRLAETGEPSRRAA